MSEDLDHLVGQLEPLCRTIETTLSDNWNHLTPPIQMKALAGETSSCLGGKVKSQESKVRSQEARSKSQESSAKSQESIVKIQ